MQRELAVIAIHGSSATSHSLHPLAKALSAEGMTVYAPDIRGHGGTGRRGDIDDAGQLDGDLADLAAAVKARQPAAALVLLGFSSGGGFALHIAGSAAGKMFARTVLLSPMLGPYAPTARPGKSPWVTPYIPRIVAITLLNRLGIHAFDHLPALAFGIPPARADLLTGVYSFRLMRAFGPSITPPTSRTRPRPLRSWRGKRTSCSLQTNSSRRSKPSGPTFRSRSFPA